MLRKKLTKLFFILLLPSLLLGDGQSKYERFKEKFKAQVTKDNMFSLGLLCLVYVLFLGHVEAEVKEQGKWWEDFAKTKKAKEEEETKAKKEKAEKLRKDRINVLIKTDGEYEDAVYNIIFSDSRYLGITNNTAKSRKILAFFGLDESSKLKNLQKNYRNIMRFYHTDQNQGDDLKEHQMNESVTKLLNDCYAQCIPLLDN